MIRINCFLYLVFVIGNLFAEIEQSDYDFEGNSLIETAPIFVSL